MKWQIAGLFVLALAASLPLAAQESDSAANVAALQEEEREQERDELQPGVPSAVLAADVERRSNGGQVMDELDLGRSEITGNQELPKVLYIVPWQKSDPGELMGKPVNTLLDEVLAPLDRSEFIRQIDYYDDLHGTDDE